MYEDSLPLLEQHRASDPLAGEKIFHRYIIWLIGLVRKMLSSNLKTWVDPEDVAQSAFHRFIRCLKPHQFVFEKWRTLETTCRNRRQQSPIER